MPKQLHEITKFTSGTITVPDVKDIAEDAASYSLNIDSVTASGKLQGVPADTALQKDGRYGSAANAIVDMDVGSIISFNGQNDVIYYEADTNKIHNIVDLYPVIAGPGNTYAAVRSSDTFTDSGTAFLDDGINLTTGGNTPFLISTSGFSNAANNTATLGEFEVESFAAGVITIASKHTLTDESAGTSSTVRFSTFSQTDMGAIVSGDDEVAMQVHNKEVHIGAGKGSTDVPKWVGYIDHKQFGTAQTAIPKIEDAELKSPTAFPSIYNAVTVGSYVYGIQYGGSRIYRFSTTAFDSASYTQFVSTQGISLLSAGTDIWLYDDNAAFGTLYKIDVSEWGTEDEISQENNITGWGAAGTALDAGFDISDIFDNGTVVWFQGFKDSGTDSGITDLSDDWLFNGTIPTSNGLLNTTDVTPTLGSHATAVGSWYSNEQIYLYKQGLVGMGVAGVIGVVCYLYASGGGTSTDGKVRTAVGASANYITITLGLVMLTVGKDYTTGDHTNITSSGTDDYQVHEVINAGSASDFGGSDYMGGFAQDGTRLFVAKTISSTSTTLFCMDDIVQATISGGASSSAPHDTVPTARDSEASIEANGLVPVPDADRNPVYMFENHDGGSFLDINYTPSTFSDLVYLERSDLRMSFTDVDDGQFEDDDTYFWKCSYMYDEYQESPLSHHFTYTPADEKHIELTIDLYNLAGLPKRVSHLVVYRAENSTAAGVANPDSFYRLVKKMKLDTSFPLQSSGWGSADFRRKIYLDQLNNIGSSYEARTLMPETLETSMVNYALSTQINSMHIIGKCYKTEISDPMNYLFKSKVNNFNQFDWTTDFLRLPMTPTALASFNGRIFAFDENNTYRINPQGFYIEDVFNGVGCFGPQSVLVTEYGMCYCDKNNIYLHDGKAPKPIGMPILTGDSSYSWHNIDTDMTPAVMFDSKRKSFMIFFKSSDGSSIRMAWAYNIIFNRWDMLNVGTADPKGFLHGKNGEMFISYSNNLQWFLGSTSSAKDLWEWQSKYMTMGEDTVKKKFYDINVVTGGTAPNVLYGVDGDTTPADDPTSESGTSNYKGKIQSTHSKSKSLQIKLVQVAGATHTVDSVGVLYRRLPKTSGNI